MARKQVQISEEQYKEAITLLEDGGTKKRACEILGIAYNTKRLDNLIVEFQQKQVVEKDLRARKRKEALHGSELAEMITRYLQGDSLEDLSSTFFRSTGNIKYYLNKHGAMLRHHGRVDPLNPPLLPDECVVDSHDPGSYAWSARYNTICKIDKEYQPGVYRIVAYSDGLREYAYQSVEELGSIQHLFDLGVRPQALLGELLDDEEIIMTINKAVHAANKRK
jgi:hypothetical protein